MRSFAVISFYFNMHGCRSVGIASGCMLPSAVDKWAAPAGTAIQFLPFSSVVIVQIEGCSVVGEHKKRREVDRSIPINAVILTRSPSGGRGHAQAAEVLLSTACAFLPPNFIAQS
jgi:hypothetical protein